jgi:hypothetical protein
MKPIVQVTLILVVLLISISFNAHHSRHQRIEIESEDPIDNGKVAKSTIIVDYTESSPAKIKYSNSAAIEYAKKFAPQETNSCGKFIFDSDPTKNMSDCAHFVAHCLKAGGIEIKRKNSADPALCPDGLTYRNTELVAALQVLAAKFENVKKIDIKDAIIGDFGFFNKFNLTRPTHAFMVCKTAVDPKDYTVYAHTRNRNCEKMEPSWMDFYDVAFRMEDGP